MSTTSSRYAYTAPFAPADNCPPIPENPLGLKASCVISNARNVSDHAFWDLYACCNGAYSQSFGGEIMCTATCVAEGQSWQELMSCLEKRAPLVVCKPDYLEIDRNETAPVSGSGNTASATGAGLTQTTGGAGASSSTAAASALNVTHAPVSKAGFALFAILAVGSAAGMFL
ncbi:hypothetical protein K505DRAFT_365963 [Melanomma pulvis-pyrius CBS 109.77]|uniref:Uncharacterized protein n=1 Tax=Melanomma pulvis-pyrius CBS 109.77 TaxID=1314802 RepID=A0A6A6WYP7_9PLEO|nr:hypothetical protein K505DRAFT_365963 [Melanomma pulvis-pyrius CBS 109.77]